MLWPFSGWLGVLFFLAGGVLIDLDHYIFYVERCRSLSIRGMFRYHERLFENRERMPYAGICVFHTLEVIGAVALLGYLYYSPLYWLFLGLVFHFLLDFYHLIKHGYTFGRALFIPEHFIRASLNRRRGYPHYGLKPYLCGAVDSPPPVAPGINEGSNGGVQGTGPLAGS